MAVALEAYTADGLLTGSVVADGRLVDMLASFSSVVVDRGVVTPFDGPPRRADGWSKVEVDDLLAVVAPPETVTPFHAVWHRISVDLGPYRGDGERDAALPGPNSGQGAGLLHGQFIGAGSGDCAELRLRVAGAGVNEHAHAWVRIAGAVSTVVANVNWASSFPARPTQWRSTRSPDSERRPGDRRPLRVGWRKTPRDRSRRVRRIVAATSSAVSSSRSSSPRS